MNFGDRRKSAGGGGGYKGTVKTPGRTVRSANGPGARARPENLRIHSIDEGSESDSTVMITSVENLLRDKLSCPTLKTSGLNVRMAQWDRNPQPSKNAITRKWSETLLLSKTGPMWFRISL